jgi:hypothetical protein
VEDGGVCCGGARGAQGQQLIEGEGLDGRNVGPGVEGPRILSSVSAQRREHENGTLGSWARTCRHTEAAEAEAAHENAQRQY